MYVTERWENTNISYIIDGSFKAKGRVVILEAMAKIESVSCIRFVETSDIREEQLVYIQSSGDECSAYPICRECAASPIVVVNLNKKGCMVS